MRPQLVISNPVPPQQRRRRFLIIEDDVDIAHLISLHLSVLDAEITLVHRGDQGLEKALNDEWDLVLLDLRLPGKDGIDVCRDLRGKNSRIPLMMLTARSTELDRVLGLELGADDYLTKPFSSLELVARVRALLRRSEQTRRQQADDKIAAEITQLAIHHLSLDKLQHKVMASGVEIELTAREFDLLWFFASQPGRVFRRGELLDQVWGYGHDGYEHTVNSHINRLRAKIEKDPTNPSLLLTVWGVGYKFLEETAQGNG